MERTVPTSVSDEIRLYRSTIYSLLRSSANIKIRTIEETHAGMNSLMHPLARSQAVDIGAFVYSYLRLPEVFPLAKNIILGQSSQVFRENGVLDIESWQVVSARARRRLCRFNGVDSLACYIASRSDIEDVIPALTALQIEWNKLHDLFKRLPETVKIKDLCSDEKGLQQLAAVLTLSVEDLERLRAIWGLKFSERLMDIQQHELSINVQLLSGSMSHYLRATHQWFENIASAAPQLTERPVYFISSNTHCLVNLMTGLALNHEATLAAYVEASHDGELKNEWVCINEGKSCASRENFLYYVMKKYQNTPQGASLLAEQERLENDCRLKRIASRSTFDVEAQVFDLACLDTAAFDPRIKTDDMGWLKRSNALILNIDYPLGLAAYNILSTLTIHADVLGVYTMGKAASLNAARGDVILPNVVQDEHSHNTYLFDNAFAAQDVAPYLAFGTVLDNQKALCVLGTFLQNATIMDVFYREGFGDIEMEAGNFLSALYEATRPKRFPMNEIVNLYNSPIDFGVLHYVSDTPLLEGKNLGAGTLSYYGMDSTYACSVAILRRIFALEKKRLMG